MAQFATYADVVALYPQIAVIPNIETIFDAYIAVAVKLNIDSTLFDAAPEFYLLASVLLSMHYIISLIPPTVTNQAGAFVWNPEDFEGKSGAINSMRRGKEAISFQSIANLTNRQSTFNETDPGKEYLALVDSVRKRIGVDGQGNLWAVLQ